MEAWTKWRNIFSTSTSSKCSFLNENVQTSNKASLKCVPWGSVGDKSSLIQVMAWCRIGNKPLPEPMMTQFIAAYVCHLTPMCQPYLMKKLPWSTTFHFISFPFQVCVRCPRTVWPCCYWREVRVPDWVSATLRACMTWDCPHTRLFTSCKPSASCDYRNWRTRRPARRERSHGEWGSEDGVDGLVQDCSISSVLAMEILQSGTEDCIGHVVIKQMKSNQSCTKPLMWASV